MSTLHGPARAASGTVAPLVVRTVEIDDPGPLLALLPPAEQPGDVLSWVRRGEGLVGWGQAATFTTAGPERFADADRWWRHTAARAVVRDEVGMPSSGLVCFGSLPFSDDSADRASFVVPRVSVGHKGSRWWVTTVGDVPTLAVTPAPTDDPLPPRNVAFADGALSSTAWAARVAEAVVAVEEDEALAAEATKTLAAQGADNAVVLTGALTAGSAKHGPFDVITIEGGVEVLPEALLAQLKDGGRIGAIFMQGAVGVAKVGYKEGGRMTWRFAFNAAAPVLPGFAVARSFAL